MFVAIQLIIQMCTSLLRCRLNLALQVSQGSASTCFRWSGHFRHSFVKGIFRDTPSNFYWNWLIFDRQGVQNKLAQFFFETRCSEVHQELQRFPQKLSCVYQGWLMDPPCGLSLQDSIDCPAKKWQRKTYVSSSKMSTAIHQQIIEQSFTFHSTQNRSFHLVFPRNHLHWYWQLNSKQTGENTQKNTEKLAGSCEFSLA